MVCVCVCVCVCVYVCVRACMCVRTWVCVPQSLHYFHDYNIVRHSREKLRVCSANESCIINQKQHCSELPLALLPHHMTAVVHVCVYFYI